MDTLIEQFLSESNLIEGVDDPKSLYLAKKAFAFLLEQEKLTVKNILEAHRILMVKKVDRDQLGVWRTVDVMVGMHTPPPFEKVPQLMNQWIEMANLTMDTHRVGMQTPFHSAAETEEHIKEDHIRFETIHPFVDGNGRIGRMLLNWQRIKCGLEVLVILNDEKWAYYEWFN